MNLESVCGRRNNYISPVLYPGRDCWCVCLCPLCIIVQWKQLKGLFSVDSHQRRDWLMGFWQWMGGGMGNFKSLAIGEVRFWGSRWSWSFHNLHFPPFFRGKQASYISSINSTACSLYCFPEKCQNMMLLWALGRIASSSSISSVTVHSHPECMFQLFIVSLFFFLVSDYFCVRLKLPSLPDCRLNTVSAGKTFTWLCNSVLFIFVDIVFWTKL